MHHYYTYTEIINNNPDKIKEWIDGLKSVKETINKYLYDNDTELLNFHNINDLVEDVIKTFNFFEKNKILQLNYARNKDLLYVLSKIITLYLYDGIIILDVNDLLKLLNFIRWNCTELLQHFDNLPVSNKDIGNYIIMIVNLSRKHKKRITGYNNSKVIYVLLMAVLYHKNTYIENFIIHNKIKITKKMISSDVIMYDAINYFIKREYNLLPNNSFNVII